MWLRVTRGSLARANGFDGLAHVEIALDRVLFYFHKHSIGEPCKAASSTRESG